MPNDLNLTAVAKAPSSSSLPPVGRHDSGAAIEALFRSATAAAIEAAHAAGLAVPSSDENGIVEARPDGTVVSIDPSTWSPTDHRRTRAG